MKNFVTNSFKKFDKIPHDNTSQERTHMEDHPPSCKVRLFLGDLFYAA